MKNEIWLGDCLELMSNIPDNSVDAIICDLPYGSLACSWDSPIDLTRLWSHYIRIAKEKTPIVLFGSQPFTSKLIGSNLRMFRYCWVWDKKKPANFSLAKKQPMKYHEDIIVFGKKSPNYFPIMVPVEGRKAKKGVNNGYQGFQKGLEKPEYLDKVYTDKYPSSILESSNADQRNRFHPTQKPIELMEYLIKTYSNERDLILDNCAGSGSTLVAAKNLKRDFVGIEREEKYFNICVDRLK